MVGEKIKVVNIYRFVELEPASRLTELRLAFRALIVDCGLKGTVILASEGINGGVAGGEARIKQFLRNAERLIGAELEKSWSDVEEMPFRRIDVKIKKEIVTLKKDVDLGLGVGSHVDPSEWNELIADPDVFVLDTRNDYEFKSGTFRNAVNPKTEKFSELPQFVAENLDPAKHKKVAMFCTGGIRCEKFAPYMKQLGFEEVYQLDGGILTYLETVDEDNSLWEGECFVFDTRVSVDSRLRKGSLPDLSQKENTQDADECE